MHRDCTPANGKVVALCLPSLAGLAAAEMMYGGETTRSYRELWFLATRPEHSDAYNTWFVYTVGSDGRLRTDRRVWHYGRWEVTDNTGTPRMCPTCFLSLTVIGMQNTIGHCHHIHPPV